MNTLPDKPSELIRVALLDLELVEADSRYAVDMTDWHSAHDAAPCEVCFAGAVMAKSLDASIGKFVSPSDFSSKTRRKLNALDFFRNGSIGTALRLFYGYQTNRSRAQRAIAKGVGLPRGFRENNVERRIHAR